jgi:ATP-dependent protease ClpP protease subunit
MTPARQAVFGFIQRVMSMVGFRPEARTQPEARPEASTDSPAWGEPEATETENGVELAIRGYIMDHMSVEAFGIPAVVSDIGFARAIAKYKGKVTSLRINSGGGDVFAGIAISALVRENAIPVTIDGVAASIASVIAAASPRVVMTTGATVMVHQPWSYAAGNSTAMRAEADILDKLRDAMLDVYVAKTGKRYTRAQWSAALTGPEGADGTWWDGTEAVATGFADQYASAPLAAARAAALVENRKAVAEHHHVPLPKNLAELPGQADPQNPEAKPASGQPPEVLASSVRVSHRKGAFYIPSR